MYRLLSLWLLAFSLMCTAAYGQSTGELRVFASQDSTIIKLDKAKLDFNKFYTLDTGVYKIVGWAPKRELMTKTVRVKPGSITSLSFKLPYTDDYKTYRAKKVDYYLKRILLRYATPAIYLVLANNYLSNINSYSDDATDFERLALEAKSNYDQSIYPADINYHKGSFNQYKRNYNDATDYITQNRNRLVISSAAAAVMTYFGWRFSARLQKPTYQEERLLSKLKLTPFTSPETSGFSLTLKLD